MERVVKEDLDTHIETNELLSKSQHGFRSGKSTQTNLIEYLNRISKWMDKGKRVDVLYLDFSKAFDVVCHERLMVKLQAAGVTGLMKAWFKDWLSNRKQRVKVEGHFSSWEDVLSSVLQGSVLGSILLNIFVDDIDEAVK